MKKHWKSWMAAVMVGGMAAAQLSGCQKQEEAAGTQVESTVDTLDETEKEAAESTEANGPDAGETEDKTKVTLGEGKAMVLSFAPEDTEVKWSQDEVTGIVFNGTEAIVDGQGAVADGAVVTIQKAGTYVVSGQSDVGQICVDAADGQVVRLVLNGVELVNETAAPVFSLQKNKIVLTLEEGTENTIYDGRQPLTEEEQEAAEASGAEEQPNGAVYSEGDLTINGTGQLTVKGEYECGIYSKGNLKIMDGAMAVEAYDAGVKGKASVVVCDGQLDIVSGKDGMKSNEDENPDEGYIWISGADIAISAGDDGIQAETALVVNGGNIDITQCQEGLAGKTVDIFDGVIKVVAEDDGINSAGEAVNEMEKMQDQEGVYTRILGGEIWLNTEADGIDSNGDLYLEGGSLYLSGPTTFDNSMIDYNGYGYMNGGIVFAAGSAGMMQTFHEDSLQDYLVAYYEEIQDAGTLVTVTDAEGKELGGFAPEKEFGAMIISMPDLADGETYVVKAGENEVEVKAGDAVGASKRPGGGPGGPGFHGGRGEFRGEKPREGGIPEGLDMPQMKEGTERPEMPEGMEPPAGRDGSKRPPRPERTERPDMPERPEMSEGGDMPGGRGRRGKPHGQDGESRPENSSESSAEAEKKN